MRRKTKGIYFMVSKSVSEVIEELEDNNKGIGVIEVVLILVVLIGLVVIFRDQLTTIINSIFERIITDSNAL